MSQSRKNSAKGKDEVKDVGRKKSVERKSEEGFAEATQLVSEKKEASKLAGDKKNEEASCEVRGVESKGSVGMSDEGMTEAKLVDDKKNEEASCAVCSKIVSNEDLALECEICETWFHISCEDITKQEYDFLSDHKSVHWYCSTCNKNVAKVIRIRG